MVTGDRPTGIALRIYAWLALAGWFGGIFTLLVFGMKTGRAPWPILLVVAASVPLVPLVVTRGTEILAPGLSRIQRADTRPVSRRFAWTIAAVMILGLGFFAWSGWAGDRARERVRSFVGSMSADARVLVDGEYFLAERSRVLRGLLANLESVPAHHSHPEEAFHVRLLDGDRRMDLELCRDSDRPREYWVYLLGEGRHRELNEVGRITTDVLDGIVPVRPPKMRRNRR
jgi:hypothetical protein